MAISKEISTNFGTREIQFLVNETIRREYQLNSGGRKIKKNNWQENSIHLNQLYESLNEILSEITECISYETRMGYCPEDEPLTIMTQIFPMVCETIWYQFKKNNYEFLHGLT